MNDFTLRRPYSSSDTGIAAADSQQQHMIFSEFGSRHWERVGTNLGCVSLPTMATNQIVVNGACGELSIVTTDGHVLWKDHTERNESFSGEKTAVSQNGKVFAVSLTQGQGGGFFDRDVRMAKKRVAVYDITSMKRLVVIEVLPLPSTRCDFAVSPDGSKLAILNDRTLSVYSVPIG